MPHTIEPKEVFYFFEKIAAIPHGSGHTKAISDFVVSFARKRDLVYRQDALGNVIVKKEATKGYEGAPPVLLQGHLDMVLATAPNVDKDMETQGLDLEVEGDYIKAKGTTLGGDDGIAVAMILALLDDDAFPHPKLEAVLTVDEEIGMLGAVGLDTSDLTAKRMINLDSDQEGVFTVSCAGGNVTHCTLPVVRAPFDGKGLKIVLDGLTGGHSGTNIHMGLGNANVLMGRILYTVFQKTDMRLISLCGGDKDNAIAPHAEAMIAVCDTKVVQDIVREVAEEIKKELPSDPRLTVETMPCEASLPADRDTTEAMLRFLVLAPNGVQVMSHEIDGLVQTSLNMGVVTTHTERLEASFCLRSALQTQKKWLTDQLTCLVKALGGTVQVSGDYPGWAYRKNSPLLHLMQAVFEEQYHKKPTIEAIHAGVECGLFVGKMGDLDCVSIGPDMLDIHTCHEKMSISSVQRTWAFLLTVLERMRAF